MRYSLRSILCLALFALAMPVLAQPQPADVDTLHDRLSPWVRQDTLLVAHIDLESADLDGLAKWLTTTMDADGFDMPQAMKDDLTEMVEQMPQAMIGEVAPLRDAGIIGITLSYGVENFLEEATDHPVIIFHLDQDADGQAALDFLPGRPLDEEHDRPLTVVKTLWEHAVVSGPVIYVQEFIDQEPGQPHPQLRTTLQAAAGYEAVVLILPSDDNRRVFEELMPILPEPFAPEPVTTLTQGIQWAALGLHLGETPSAKLHIQSLDAASAQRLHAMIRGLPDTARKMFSEGPVPGNAEIMLDLLKELTLLVPEPQGDHIVSQWDDEQITAIARELLVPPLMAARQTAVRMQAMRNVRQIMMGCWVYANNNEEQFPASLELLVEGDGITADMLINSRELVAEGDAYVQVPIPGPDAKLNTSSSILVYEAYDAWPAGGITAGYMDGHAEWIGDQQAFEEQLQATLDAIEALEDE